MTRIIAGRHRGHRLATPKGELTRPTSDRVREALFSALTSWLAADGAPEESLLGIAFLDLFAGSGAIGLEAASRGAGPVVLVEKDRRTADLARANATTLGARVEVRAASAEATVSAPAPRAFDVIWLDPPYAVTSQAVDQLVAEAVENGWLADDGLVVVERATRGPGPEWPERFTDDWSRRYGETTLYYATTAPRESEGEDADEAEGEPA